MACVLLLVAVAGAQTVEGTIVNTATGRGIPGAHVILFRAGERASQPLYSATADSGGRFSIENVKEGTYTPRYSAEHFFAANAIPNGPEFHVVATTSPVRLEGRLAPNARITGRVLDGRGDPAPNARVDLTLSKAFWTALTDSQGRFDLDSAIAGPSDYRLSALPPAGWKPPNSNPASRQPREWARTFYPAALRREEAAPLVLFPGIDIPDLEIRLLAVDVHVVRGMLVTAEGAQAAKVPLSLWDEIALRALAAQVLRTNGYTVLEASTGEDAERTCCEFKGSIALLVTDVVMPGMNGLTLAGRLHASQPLMRVLYMSGYAENVLDVQDELGPMTEFLQKPFAPSVLVRRVRELLDVSI